MLDQLMSPKFLKRNFIIRIAKLTFPVIDIER